jgi:hypothetical protein
MDLPPPQDPQALMALAQAISADLPIAFCRIDLFETGRGPVVGELTPEPGGYQNFDAACDAYLGLWHDLAQARLALDALGEIVGRIDNERMLDKLFASFCIGK